MTGEIPTTRQIRQIVTDADAERFERRETCAAGTTLAQLHDQLVEAAKAYESNPEMPRESACAAIIATSEYLKGQGFSDSTILPLNRVVWAIVEISQKNLPDPLFSKKSPNAMGNNTKSKRSLRDAVRQGHLAALADCWLKAYRGGEDSNPKKLEAAARYFTGKHFGKLEPKMLDSARTYLRQPEPNELIVQSYDQMMSVLISEADALGGGENGFRDAVKVQIKALNEKVDLANP